MTWEEVGTVFEGQLRVSEVVAGPDGRLYAAVYRAGPPTAETGVYRTVEPVAVTVDAEESAPAGTESFRLGTPYPNPSSGSSTIPLTLEGAAEVRLVVYDVLGREVALLHEGGGPPP